MVDRGETWENEDLLTRLSSSLAARKCDSMASKSIFGIAVSMLYTSKLAAKYLHSLKLTVLAKTPKKIMRSVLGSN